MPTQTTSKRPAKRKQTTALGESLFRAADEMVSHIKGKIALPVRYLEPVGKVDVLAIRNKLGLPKVSLPASSALTSGCFKIGSKAGASRRAPYPPI